VYMPARAVLRFAWTISFALVLITFSGLPSSLARSLYARAASRSVSKVPRYSVLQAFSRPRQIDALYLLPCLVTPV